ncbi:hypothetical protein UO65_6375 [Actinokineospora spheciospongiae]|uniref:Uncharacterized protein n=1 Tax=Actinokineospora spheciospongiae TaxID=909613 RepID=W7ID50_9PSEU|nr:hypothetical protein UO65_6375 [Actinokineospora spheciospongiae]
MRPLPARGVPVLPAGAVWWRPPQACGVPALFARASRWRSLSAGAVR